MTFFAWTYAYLVNFKVCGVLSPELSYQQRKSSLSIPNTMCGKNLSLTRYTKMGFIEGACLKMRSVVSCTITMLQLMVAIMDRIKWLQNQASFYWPTLFKDARKFVMTCNQCQQTENISKRHEMPQSGILEVELFNVWGIDFMGPFPPSHNNLYILVVVD